MTERQKAEEAAARLLRISAYTFGVDGSPETFAALSDALCVAAFLRKERAALDADPPFAPADADEWRAWSDLAEYGPEPEDECE